MKKSILSSLVMIALSSTSYAAMNNAPAQTGLVFEGQISANHTGSLSNVTHQWPNGYNILTTHDSTDHRNVGIGGGVFLGYDFAITPNMTVGAKVGYRNLQESNNVESTSTATTPVSGSVTPDMPIYIPPKMNIPASGSITPDMPIYVPSKMDIPATSSYSSSTKLNNIQSIPLLATWNYFFNSGWLVGADAGIDIQKLSVSSTYSYTHNGRTQSRSKTFSQWNIAPMVGLTGGYKWQNGIALTGNLSYVFGKNPSDLDSGSYQDPEIKNTGALAVWTLGINLSYTLPL
ncbi:hypothetical protein L3V83_03620 [Thiotrichales bacterium 19X7-9]|nr:hypothetical protein [Thiotrichales bacterium 19X7-9]